MAIFSFNPMLSYIHDAAQLLHDGMMLKDGKQKLFGLSNAPASGMLSVAAAHCFANNLMDLRSVEGPPNDLASKYSVLTGEGVLEEIDMIFLRELMLVEHILCNPQRLLPHQRFFSGIEVGIDFERTPVFFTPVCAEMYHAGEAAVSLGVSLSLIGRMIVEHLKLSDAELRNVFGVTFRDDDGFRDIFDPPRLNKCLSMLDCFRADVRFDSFRHQNILKEENYALTFLDKFRAAEQP